MARSDYSHWNEEQDRIWWEEEGKHEVDNDPRDLDDDYAEYYEDHPPEGCE